MKFYLIIAFVLALPSFTGFKFIPHWSSDISLAGITKEIMATAPNPNGWLIPEARTQWQHPDRDSKIFHSMFPTFEKFQSWIEVLEESGRAEADFGHEIRINFY